MDLDIFVPMPRATPIVGDNVLYSTRAYVGAGNGRPPALGPLLSGEQQMNKISISFQADQVAIVKLQFWDVVAGAWVTVNNGGAGDSFGAGTGLPVAVSYDRPGGGDWQVVVNFAVAPTSWKVPAKVRLTKKQN